MSEVAEIYDQLLKFESKNYSKEPYPVHKKLRFQSGSDDLLDWLASIIHFKNDDYILDAGCGTGHTLFYLNKRFGLQGLGISISPEEINYAQEACQKNDLKSKLNFKLEDFQFHNAGTYTKIICIESLKHAQDLKLTLCNLFNRMSKNGLMVIIDDFLVSKNKSLKKQKALWSSPGFNDVETYQREIEAAGSFHCQKIDLSSYVPSRPVWKLNLFYSILSIVNVLVAGPVKRNINTYLGGLLLEKLYAQKKVRYMVLIIKNKTL
jgi:cyclopropane fatty-acyl-phospholipid synthase-like methyltransferase